MVFGWFANCLFFSHWSTSVSVSLHTRREVPPVTGGASSSPRVGRNILDKVFFPDDVVDLDFLAMGGASFSCRRDRFLHFVAPDPLFFPSATKGLRP